MNARNFLVVAITLCAALAAGVWAASPVPHMFQSGTPALASEVNANFDALTAQISALEAQLASAQRKLEAESATLSSTVVTGTTQADATASGGQARYGAGGGTTGPEGQLFGVTATESGSKLGTGLTRVSFRLKVTNTSSASVLANINCSALRAGATDWASLGSINIKPADLPANQTWATYTLVCDWRPDDADQFVGVDGFKLGITDLWVDYLQFQPVIESTTGLVTILAIDSTLSDQRNKAGISNYGEWYPVLGRTLKFVKRYPTSKLKVTYQDTLGSLATAYAACEWQILLDTTEIARFSAADFTRPAGAVWMMENAAHIAWATARAGSHTITIRNRGNTNVASAWGSIVTECLMGWNTTGNFVSVEEIP